MLQSTQDPKFINPNPFPIFQLPSEIWETRTHSSYCCLIPPLAPFLLFTSFICLPVLQPHLFPQTLLVPLHPPFFWSPLGLLTIVKLQAPDNQASIATFSKRSVSLRGNVCIGKLSIFSTFVCFMLSVFSRQKDRTRALCSVALKPESFAFSWLCREESQREKKMFSSLLIMSVSENGRERHADGTPLVASKITPQWALWCGIFL